MNYTCPEARSSRVPRPRSRKCLRFDLFRDAAPFGGHLSVDPLAFPGFLADMICLSHGTYTLPTHDFALVLTLTLLLYPGPPATSVNLLQQHMPDILYMM